MRQRTKMKNIIGRIRTGSVALLFLFAYTISLVGPFVPTALAAVIADNKVSINFYGFTNTSDYKLVDGQPTAPGEFETGKIDNRASYVEGACIPVLYKVTNDDNVAGDINIVPGFDYRQVGDSQQGYTDLELVTTSLANASALTNLNQLNYSGSSLSEARSFSTTSGGIVNASVSGVYAGETGSQAPSSTDKFRHYNVTLYNVPAGETVNVLACARLGLDSSQYSGASLSVRNFGSGGKMNRAINPSNLLILPSITLIKEVIGDAFPSDFSFTVSPAVNGQPTFNIPTGSDRVVVENVNPDGAYTITESTVDGYTFTGGSGSACVVVGSTVGTVAGQMTATVSAGKPASNASCTFVNKLSTGSLTVVKEVQNNYGGTLKAADFPLFVNGQSVTSGAVQTLPAGDYTITETQQAGYDFVDIVCKNGSTQLTVTDGKFTLPKDANVTCTVTNKDKPANLTLVKEVVNNNGGTAVATDWTLNANGPSTISGATGTDKVTNVSVSVGTYNLSESGGPSGYAASDWVCEGGVQNGSSVTLGLGQSATCTIVNDDIAPKLILNKIVVNNNGGKALESAWLLKADGGVDLGYISGNGAVGDQDVVSGTDFKAGSYTLSESGETPGYTASTWVCTNKEVVNSVVTIGLGETVACTITNDDEAPYLTLVKLITNDNGGTATVDDFILSATNEEDVTNVISGVSGTPSVSNIEMIAGSYELKESNLPGYSPSLWSCKGGSLNGNLLLIALGQNVTCTIINDDIAPKLTLIKKVINDNGGTAKATDWTLNAAGPTPLSGVTGVTSGATFKAGTYVLSESNGPSGYTAGSWSCTAGALTGDSLVLALGDDATCTITNNDQPGTLIVNKVLNDPYSDAVVSDFSYSVNGGTAVAFEADGSNEKVIDSGDYKVVETPKFGYDVKYDNCEVTITPGSTETCTITNTAVQPKLIVKKIVDNSNGGTAVASDFSFAVNGGAGITFEADGQNELGVKAGTYNVVELGIPIAGYSTSYEGCSNITIANGETKTCTITNDDIAPQLTLVKKVKNDNGGEAKAADFKLSAAGPTPISGMGGVISGEDFKAGTYALGETGEAGYHVGIDWACSPIANTGNKITLKNGESTTCTIVNDDDKASLSGTKTIANTDLSWATDGTAPVSGWIIYLDQNQNGILDQDEDRTTTDAFGNYIFDNLKAGETYFVKEVISSLGDGWEQTSAPDAVNIAVLGGSSTGNDFTNKAFGYLTVVKQVDPATDDGLFNLLVNGEVKAANVKDEGTTSKMKVDAGTYEVSETAGTDTDLSHYNSSWVCETEAREVGKNGTITSVTVKPGEDWTCTFTNVRKQGKVTVVKQIIDQYGGTATVEDFSYKLTNQVTTETVSFTDGGKTYSLPVGSTFNVEEKAVMDGYRFTSAEGCQGTVTETDQTCTITNAAVQPKLTVIKKVNNEGTYMTAESSDFTMEVDGTDVTSASFLGSTDGVTVGLDQGRYEASETADGYTITTDPTDKQADYFATLSPDCKSDIKVGEEKTCTIINTAIQKPEVNIVKEANVEVALEGHTITYTFTVTNTGNTPLRNVKVTDPLTGDPALVIGGDVNQDSVLDRGEIWTYTVEYVVPTGSGEIVNVAVATGESPDGSEATDDDTVIVDVVHPSIAVVKSGPETARPGQMVTYIFTVRNTGDVPLDITKVEDDIAGIGEPISGDVNDNRKIDTDEVWIYSASYAIPSDAGTEIKNTVTVCASEELTGSKDCTSDSHITKVFRPQILSIVAPTQPELVNTGTSVFASAVIALLTMLSAALVLGRRKYAEVL